MISSIKELYKELDNDNRDVFLQLAQEQYKAVEPHGKNPPDKEWLAALLLAYNATMLYVYDSEVLRKRDRLAEAINSTTAKATEIRKGLTYWSRMTQWFSVDVSDEATLKSFSDSGVKKVKWNTNLDGKECKICRERDGKIYPINNVPPKPHPNCRCWFTAVTKDEN